MKSLNRIAAMLLSLILVVGMLASCGGPDVPLQSDVYVATVEISFETDDEDMKTAVQAMKSSGSKIYVSGEDMKIETSAELNNISLADSYVYFGGTLYHENRLTVDGKTSVTLEKAALSSENRQQLISDVGAGASIDPIDFNIQERDGDELNYTYNCSRITGKAQDSLEAIFASRFGGLNATVELEAAELTIEGENGRNKSSRLSCHFVITMNGQSYEITMNMNTTYDYDSSFGISAPAGSSSYKQVSYDEIIK